MGRTITIASGKGGVGKTTLTANLGIALSQAGFSVCLIDADVAMANLSLLLGMQSSPITLHDVLLGEASAEDAIYDGPSKINFIPSGLSLESYKRVDSERLESVVKDIADRYDFILLDAPAGIEKNVLSSISAASELLLVATPDAPSIADVLKTKIVAQRIGSKPIGVVINLVRGEKGEISSEDVMKMLELPIYGLIPYDEEVRKSFLQEKISPVIVRKPSAPASLAIQKIALKLSGKQVVFEVPKKQSFFSSIFGRLFSIFKKKKQGE